MAAPETPDPSPMDLAARVTAFLEREVHEDQCACTPGPDACVSGTRMPSSWTVEQVLDAAETVRAELHGAA